MNARHLWVLFTVVALMGFTGCDEGGSANNDSGPDTDTDTDSDTDTDTDTDSDSDTDSDTESETETETETEPAVECWESLDAESSGSMSAFIGDTSDSVLSFNWMDGDSTVLYVFAISSWSTMGGPTTAGEYLVDTAMAEQTGGLVVLAQQVDMMTYSTELLYRPVEGTGSVTITEIPSVFDDTAVGETFAGSVSLDMQQISTTTGQPVPDGCYLEDVQFDFDEVITAY